MPRSYAQEEKEKQHREAYKVWESRNVRLSWFSGFMARWTNSFIVSFPRRGKASQNLGWQKEMKAS
eukprot:972558-Pelagomonas_calceolata.AAC.2